EEDFRGHAGELLRVLAAVRELGDDWADEEPWPATFSQWLAVLHSGVTVARQRAAVPRGVYDQHLQVLANSGIELLKAGELTGAKLQASLAQLVLRARHETEQRMWLSDIRYAIGSQDATTAVAAADERLEYLTAEQKRIDDAQGKNPAQRRASDTDDHYTTWAQEIRKRIDAFMLGLEQLGILFPSLEKQLPGLVFDTSLLKARKEVWLARELGYMPYKQAVVFVGLMKVMTKQVDAQVLEAGSPKLTAQAKEGFEAVRTVAALVDHPADPEQVFGSTWQAVVTDLEELELGLLVLQGGPQCSYAGMIRSIRRNIRGSMGVRVALRGSDVNNYFATLADLRKEMEGSADAGVTMTRILLDAGEQDVMWALLEKEIAFVSGDLVSREVKRLTESATRDRIFMGLVSPTRIMLLLAQTERMRHLAADPAAFVSTLRTKVRKLARGVQANLLDSALRKVQLANATEDTRSAELIARLETMATTWAEVVHFGFVDEAIARDEVKQGQVFERLAGDYRMPDLGRQTAVLFDLHLRVVRGPERPSDAKKWRDGIVEEIGRQVRSWKNTQGTDSPPPVRYAGRVLDALVELAEKQTPPPRPDFGGNVRGVRTALQKLTAGTVYYPADIPVFTSARPPQVPDVLSEQEQVQVSRALDELATMVPLVLDGKMAASDYDAASLQVARLVVRQTDSGLILRAATLAMLADRPLDPSLIERATEALLEFNRTGKSPGGARHIDTRRLLEDLGSIIKDVLAGTGLLYDRFGSAMKLADSDREWRESGYRQITTQQLETWLGAGEVTAFLGVLVTRVVALTVSGVQASAGGMVPRDTLREQLAEIPDLSAVLTQADRRQLDGFIELSSVHHHLESLGRTLVPEELFMESLDGLAATMVMLKAEPAEPAQDALGAYHAQGPGLLSQLAFNAEYGGIDMLPRFVAVMAVREEIGYRSSVADRDGVEAVRRFGRWLGALEHAGLEAFRVSPGVMRSAFVRLLSVEVPAGFEERLGVLAARLASPEVLGQPVALDAVARVALRERLREEDVRARVKSPRVGGGQEIRDGVVEVVARLGARRTEAVASVGGIGEAAGLEGFRRRAERWLGEPLSFQAALESLESGAVVEPLPTPSGFFVPVKGVGGFADDGAVQLRAAFGFPVVG
ncbi:hypothetical protein, partial [Kitasatospora sp. NE20-6]|uniref:hypothetical protein n=1 Tax=Kitasatospora sp. NE20-6 TaxID=2859066 RepID=UPI0038B27BDF